MMRWRMLALLFAARVGLGFSFQTTASASEGISAAFGLGSAEIGMMIGLFTAPGLVLALPAGLSDRFASDRLLAGLGLATLSIGGLIAAAAAGPEALTFGRIISGIGALFGTLYFTKMVADLFEGREMATAMSILVISWPFGIAMGQVGHTWLATEFGWRVPFAGTNQDDLSGLFGMGAKLGEQLAGQIVDTLEAAPVTYGKAALVGLAGTSEHGAALLHPRLGKPVRTAIGGGTSLMSSNVKVATVGSSIDLPLGHKDEAWSFDHIDTMSMCLPDAPLPDEILVAVAMSDGARIRARVGSGPVWAPIWQGPSAQVHFDPC